jgi:hypothetical protein
VCAARRPAEHIQPLLQVFARARERRVGRANASEPAAHAAVGSLGYVAATGLPVGPHAEHDVHRLQTTGLALGGRLREAHFSAQFLRIWLDKVGEFAGLLFFR